MKALDVTGALRRRWYLLLAGMLATGGLLAAAVQQVGPTHEVRSTVLLVPPPISVVDYPSRESPSNPFLRLDGLDPVVSVLVTQMTSKQMSEQVLAGRPGADYTVVADPTTQAPLIIVNATGVDNAQAEALRDDVIAAMPRALLRLQNDAQVPPKARITLTDLVVDPQAHEVWRTLTRFLILITGVGLLGTVLFVGAVDAIIRSRREARARRRESAEADDEDEPDQEAPAEPDEPTDERAAKVAKGNGRLHPLARRRVRAAAPDDDDDGPTLTRARAG